MNKYTSNTQNEISTLAENATALMNATADVAGEKVEETRRRLLVTLENMKAVSDRVRGKAIEGVKAADKAIRENPYQSLGIALGVGALFGFFISSRRYGKAD